jgi:GntR family transcriptional regulator of arabinose operon
MAIQSTEWTKHERVSHDLLVDIQFGKFRPGQRLPTELELAKHYGLSRGSVRKALGKLQMDGLVVKRQGSGTYVAREADRSSPVSLEKSICLYNFPMVEDLSPWFGASIYEGLTQEAGKRKIGLVLEQATEGNRLTSRSEGLIGAIVLVAGNQNPTEFLSGLPAHLPKVVMNRPSPDDKIPSIEFDNEYGAFQAVSFLLRIGHRRIAFVRSDVPNLPYLERYKGYQKAYAAAGLDVDPALIPSEPSTSMPEYSRWPDLLRKLVRGTPRPTALLMMNHGRSLHILDVLAHEGIRVPEDLSLILFDEERVMLHHKPTISSVRAPQQEMGRTAVRMIVEMSKADRQGPVGRCPKLLPELMIRDSVGLPCGEK